MINARRSGIYKSIIIRAVMTNSFMYNYRNACLECKWPRVWFPVQVKFKKIIKLLNPFSVEFVMPLSKISNRILLFVCLFKINIAFYCMRVRLTFPFHILGAILKCTFGYEMKSFILLIVFIIWFCFLLIIKVLLNMKSFLNFTYLYIYSH